MSLHRMPFGAETLPGGGIRFRLWAPDAEAVHICLESGGSEYLLAMPRLEGGWFERSVNECAPEQRYRFQLPNGLRVPDPAARFNPGDVHGASEVINPEAYRWRDSGWRGRPWTEAVIYELHVGCFTPGGTFRTVIDRLDYLRDVGITAIELMPVADFPGRWNWGYDGALLFAPDASYGRPEDLKALIDAAHERGLMVFLDVVYNHFGPEGNYLHCYAEEFFTESHHTPWGAAIDLERPVVRDFFIHNALYWLEEYHFDGLRLDAVHAIFSEARESFLRDLAQAVHAGPGRQRHVHLILENDANEARHLEGNGFRAQWNDDIHHAFHVLLTGEKDGYYADYAAAPATHLGRCLSEGFAYQGDVSAFRHGEKRGEPSRHLPPSAFVSFLQNHDQIGNRAFGERLTQLTHAESLHAALAVMLLAPAPPLLFMGEEFGAQTPFLFFCDFGTDLRDAVREGRRREFARFERFSDPAARAAIPDPGAESTFLSSRLNWEACHAAAGHFWQGVYRALLTLRQERIVPLLGNCKAKGYSLHEAHGIEASWQVMVGRLHLIANLGQKPVAGMTRPRGEMLYATPPELEDGLARSELPAWSAAWFLERDQ
jgi:maltooligosyltrehalose trehalohydrolase